MVLRLFIVAALLSALPLGALAVPEIDYARVVEHSATEALVRQSSFTKEYWWRCSFQTRACAAADENTLVAAPEPVPPFMLAYRALLPAGAGSLHRSPDGRYIAFYVPATQKRNTRTFGVMDTTDLSVYTKTETVSYWDLLTEGVNRYYHFSPDSKTLLYIDDVRDHPTLYRVDMDALGSLGNVLPSERLFSREYSVADVVWKDTDSIFYVANRDNPYAWGLYELDIETYSLKKLADNVSYADTMWRLPAQAGNGEKLLFAESDERGVRPALYNLATGAVEHFALPKKEALATDGQVVTTLKAGLSGVFLLEESGWSDTLVVWLHGGPYRQAATSYHPFLSYGGYDWVLERMRQADVGVLKLDYPGSFGFGREFAESITGGIGTVDADAAAAAIADFAARNSYKEVYLMGNSYGGYLALKLLVDHPGRYKGALSINGVADWLTLLTKLDTSIFNVQFGGTVDDANRQMYQNASIYNYTDRLGAQKVVLVHGERDTTVPVSQSEGLATYLSLIGKRVRLITIPNEDHVYKKPESFETLCGAALALVVKADASPCTL